ncbi:lipopolysaccharide biosynthesis protein [Granulicella mallensis]|uniref:Polysaccharide biosynthesis protein n=1 Tax=Granulicella mallensis (strain ATCC BAA-1857 / DSM 23137 / MP5ACTX8) TaxID=682795 RepID=G8NYL7_GRAMM|nr:polysaccharide biosynthesis protein [Granulicella mallensis]AEU39076.1 polysaccharide biosynthesis protein [Granulicella mallensis MP5ACTX8]
MPIPNTPKTTEPQDPERALTAAGEAAFVQPDATLPPSPPEATPPERHPDPEPAGAPTGLLRRLLHFVGVDRAIAFTVLARGWSSLAGVGTLALIARFLSPADQGFYYAFYSLVQMQIIFELGFSVVILQAASHEAAHLNLAPDGTITGPEQSHARLASVLQKAFRWYTIAAILMALTLMPVGIAFFRHIANKSNAGDVHFVLPWLLVVFASSCTFQIDPIFSFLEGCGYIPEVYRTRLRQSLLSTVLGWSAFLLHHGLYAPGFFILGQAIAGGWFIFTKRHLLLPLLRHSTRNFRIDWGKEIWPFQWRIAVSWLAGYLTSSLFVPVLMNSRGPVEAGRLGMSLTVCATLSTMAVSWMNTKASPFGQMIARKEYRKLDGVFTRALVQSTGAAVLACIAVWVVVQWLLVHQVKMHGVLLANRLLSPIPLAMLFFGTVGNVVVTAEALYIRAHKQEKFMVNSILGALYSIPVALVIGTMQSPHGGAWGIAASYALGTAVIGLGYGTYTFLKWRRIWHEA